MLEHDPVTLRGFLGMWEMMAYHNWRLAFKYLCYLGIKEEIFSHYLDVLPFRCVYYHCMRSVFSITSERTCFFAYVVGPRKSGKVRFTSPIPLLIPRRA
jgi:hypothetical protein